MGSGNLSRFLSSWLPTNLAASPKKPKLSESPITPRLLLFTCLTLKTSDSVVPHVHPHCSVQMRKLRPRETCDSSNVVHSSSAQSVPATFIPTRSPVHGSASLMWPQLNFQVRKHVLYIATDTHSFWGAHQDIHHQVGSSSPKHHGTCFRKSWGSKSTNWVFFVDLV